MGATGSRIYQAFARIGTALIKWPVPVLVEGVGSVACVPDLLERAGVSSVLVVTSAGLYRRGLLDGLIKALDEAGIEHAVFSDVMPNPTIPCVEAGVARYRAAGCAGLVAFGGGSVMDCAKGIGARMVRPERTIEQMRGLMKVGRDLPTLVAIPTTAGTGSETTLAAVVSDPATHAKFALNDPHLVPRYAVLDPVLTVGLPPDLTATTGLDALTHAVEAYIGHSNTELTERSAKEAVALIFEWLPKAYANGEDLEARGHMLHASYEAGVAFTRAYVGYVHAVAHTLGGFYGVAHGLANAVILPVVLDYYGDAAWTRLSDLAQVIGVGGSGSAQTDAQAFIAAIRKLEAGMDIPAGFDCIREEDLPQMIDNALREGNPLYPVPREFDRADFEHIYRAIML